MRLIQQQSLFLENQIGRKNITLAERNLHILSSKIAGFLFARKGWDITHGRITLKTFRNRTLCRGVLKATSTYKSRPKDGKEKRKCKKKAEIKAATKSTCP